MINTNLTPASPGGTEQAMAQGMINDMHTGNPSFDTADFNDDSASGNLRVDYVLPSRNLPLARCSPSCRA